MNSRGTMLVIEGSDGSGKGTQVQLLATYCKEHAVPYEVFDFPQYTKTFFGNLCGRYLNGEFGKDVSPYLATLPYAADRWQAKPSIEKALSEGKLVIVNRYAPSNAVYHAARLPVDQRQGFMEWEFQLEYTEYAIPHEDLVIYLHVPVSISQQLIDTKAKREYLTSGKRKDILEENVELLKTTESLYDQFCKKYPYWVCIECCEGEKLLSKEIIHEKITLSLKTKNIL